MPFLRKSPFYTALLPVSLLMGCSSPMGHGTAAPSPYPTHIQSGSWFYANTLVDGNNGCNIPAPPSDMQQALRITVPDQWIRAWDMTVPFSLDPAAMVSDLHFECESSDGLTFQCQGGEDAFYQPDASKDAILPIRHSVSGSFGSAVSFCGNYTEAEIDWHIEVTGPCQGADCADSWPENAGVQSPCTSLLKLSSTWNPEANGAEGCI